MCGIAGTFNLTRSQPPAESTIRRMLASLRHRGPDEFGIYFDEHATLGSARLSIVDLENGQQPIANEDESLWIVFNGEIFNDAELREELIARGHRFRTKTDTEVLLHLFEEFGPEAVRRLNGDFAFAIWNAVDQTFFLARDRVGVRPLFYTVASGRLIFASEIKAILAHPDVAAAIDTTVLHEVFTFWNTLGARTIFKNVCQLPPGHWLVGGAGAFEIRRYWQLEFPDARDTRTEVQLAADLEALLEASTTRRLRADVPVGAYLSGGLDSSLTAAIARRHVRKLKTFSISFSDREFDESGFQMEVARFLGTDHEVIHATPARIMEVLPDVVWHAETPIMRPAPAPMFLLSQLARKHDCKVVLTGEGADEFFGGYDLFKEAKIRAWWARQPRSRCRPRLLRRLYSDIAGLSGTTDAFLTAFFGENLTRVSDTDYSHAIRWRNNRRTTRFINESPVEQSTLSELLEIPASFSRWDIVERAQYLESTIFLPQYLLSSQGDRMAMAHGVEGRFPFLDPAVIDFATQLPPRLKLRVLQEKYLLRKAAMKYLPPAIANRPKRPYRAPIDPVYFTSSAPDYVRELLSEPALRSAGLFKPIPVAQLMNKMSRGVPIGETDAMAVVGILSAQLLHFQFVENFRVPEPLPCDARLKVCRGKRLQEVL